VDLGGGYGEVPWLQPIPDELLDRVVAGASSAELLWITDIYGFLIAGSLVAMGTRGDRVGRRRLLTIGG
jgi:hypothetical protein